MHEFIHILAGVSGVDIGSLPKVENPGASQIQSILTIVFTIIGAISVLMFVIGGLRYVAAQGDPGQLAKAKGTLIYAIVGLLVSITAVAIVTFVIGNIL
jgi:heme/copper-type cytochrome/quinol oxidase subunit 2